MNSTRFTLPDGKYSIALTSGHLRSGCWVLHHSQCSVDFIGGAPSARGIRWRRRCPRPWPNRSGRGGSDAWRGPPADQQVPGRAVAVPDHLVARQVQPVVAELDAQLLDPVVLMRD